MVRGSAVWSLAASCGRSRWILFRKQRSNDYVMVHVGFAISKVAADEAERTYKLLAEMGALEEELALGSEEQNS